MIFNGASRIAVLELSMRAWELCVLLFIQPRFLPRLPQFLPRLPRFFAEAATVFAEADTFFAEAATVLGSSGHLFHNTVGIGAA